MKPPVPLNKPLMVVYAMLSSHYPPADVGSEVEFVELAYADYERFSFATLHTEDDGKRLIIPGVRLDACYVDPGLLQFAELYRLSRHWLLAIGGVMARGLSGNSRKLLRAGIAGVYQSGGKFRVCPPTNPGFRRAAYAVLEAIHTERSLRG